ncbi:MAG: methylenetetrahydrofolate reductase [NAD(P)H] [Burkholderiaceae bacterium]
MTPSSTATTPVISFEFFPPNTPVGVEKLVGTRASLNALNPAFYSVTYGAGGATQEKTYNTVSDMAAEGLAVAPHISCIGSTRESIAELLARYQALGVDRLVALRGDLPSGAGPRHGGDFRYASDLVTFIRETTGQAFHIEVAAYPEKHPQAQTYRDDLKAFATKIEAGADSAITQYFFSAEAYFRFREDCAAAGVTAPIVPGIMPIMNATQLIRFSEACGAEIPRWIRLRLLDMGDDLPAIRQFGHEVICRLCEQLMAGGAPGLHFYTLNQAGPTELLCKDLGLGRS